jgi:hypothetical protein
MVAMQVLRSIGISFSGRAREPRRNIIWLSGKTYANLKARVAWV